MFNFAISGGTAQCPKSVLSVDIIIYLSYTSDDGFVQ